MADWIKGAIKHPGALHRDLGIPQGQKIPQRKLKQAAGHRSRLCAARQCFDFALQAAPSILATAQAEGGRWKPERGHVQGRP